MLKFMSEQATFHLGTGEFNAESTGCKREKRKWLEFGE
jgi:hypothetical protein